MTVRRVAAAATVAALAVGAQGFHCPPVNYVDNTATVPLAGGKVFLPVYKHEPSSGKAASLAVIALHGAGRNGDNYHGWVTNAMSKQGMGEKAVVITPVFPDKPCTASQWLGNPTAKGQAVSWARSTRQWVFGQTSDDVGDWEGISSFEAVDDLIEYIELRYKNLEKIVVTGFSAGAQMGLRWSILSLQGVQGKTTGGTPLQIILGSPSSVTYLNDRRPAKSCSRLEDQSPEHNCTSFLVPGSGGDSQKSCRRHWNRYGFGISGLERGSARKGTIRSDVSKYVHRYATDDTMLQQLIPGHFATKNIVFQFGTTDTKDCIRGACADDCGAMVQGTSRLQRGLNYMWHLKDTFPGYEPKFSTFVGGHRPELFFAGDYFNQAAFGKSGWEECLWDSLSCFSFLVQCIVGGCAFLLGGAIVGTYCCIHRKHREEAVRREAEAHGYQRYLQEKNMSIEEGQPMKGSKTGTLIASGKP